MSWTDVVGIIGVVCTLIAYLFLQIGRITPNDSLYPFLNLIGAIFILCSLMGAWNWSAVIIETFWAFISIYGIYRSLQCPKKVGSEN